MQNQFIIIIAGNKCVHMIGLASQLTNGKLTNGKGIRSEETSTSSEAKTENGTGDDAVEYRRKVHGLASALLQIGQGVDMKYFNPSFGSLKAGRKEKEAAFDMWCVSLMDSINFSQLFLHYEVLYNSIEWTRSAQKPENKRQKLRKRRL